MLGEPLALSKRAASPVVPLEVNWLVVLWPVAVLVAVAVTEPTGE
jgi:hypothetical protein